ncbi:MAG: thioredoxin family protein [Pirellulales bacterium]|nr:thioredoxin family protein [Pirellulales bacterium]
MTLSKILLVGCVAPATLAWASGAQAAEIGKPIPAWADLPGADGKTHGLDDYKDAKILVVAFMCNHCPISRMYEGRVKAIQKEYGKKGVQVVAINVNNFPEDRLDKMIERAKAEKFNFPYLYDSSQKVARDYGATCTPHVFVLDRERRLAYEGAVDDANKLDQAKKHHLREAIDAVLDGKTPETTKTDARGCSIKWDKPAEE